MATFMTKKPICKHCNKEMFLDDVDFNFKGNQDEYWLCEKCGDSVFAKVRYGKVISQKYEENPDRNVFEKNKDFYAKAYLELKRYLSVSIHKDKNDEPNIEVYSFETGEAITCAIKEESVEIFNKADLSLNWKEK